jgi:hypothetical protein
MANTSNLYYERGHGATTRRLNTSGGFNPLKLDTAPSVLASPHSSRVFDWMKKAKISRDAWEDLVELFYPNMKAFADYLDTLCPECLNEGSFQGNLFICDFC